MGDDFLERLRIREIVENWAVWRDQGDWERFRTVWHADGIMNSTYFQGPFEEFIARSRKAWAGGTVVLHLLGGSAVTIAGARAIAETKMSINSRDRIDGVLCDVTCIGRFYDFFARREERWAIVLRQPIYEMDRLDPVDREQHLVLDAALLARFPEGYRHLAYAQTKRGLAVKAALPGLKGPEVERLYARGAAWLAGGPLERD